MRRRPRARARRRAARRDDRALRGHPGRANGRRGRTAGGHGAAPCPPTRRVAAPRRCPSSDVPAELEALLGRLSIGPRRTGRSSVVIGEAGIGKSRLLDAVAESVRARRRPGPRRAGLRVGGGHRLRTDRRAAADRLARSRTRPPALTGLSARTLDDLERLVALPAGLPARAAPWHPVDAHASGRSRRAHPPDRGARRRPDRARRRPAARAAGDRGRPVGGRFDALAAGVACPPARRTARSCSSSRGARRTSTSLGSTFAATAVGRAGRSDHHARPPRSGRRRRPGRCRGGERPRPRSRSTVSSPSRRGCRCSWSRPCRAHRSTVTACRATDHCARSASSSAIALASVSETGAQVLAAAAVIGRSFDLDLVRRSSGRSEDETVGALEELVRRGLVRETGVGPGMTFDFAHAKFRDAVYEGTSLARRRLLHGRTADLLRATPGLRDDPGRLVQVAIHERDAGRDAEAADAFREAGPAGSRAVRAARGRLAPRDRARARPPRRRGYRHGVGRRPHGPGRLCRRDRGPRGRPPPWPTRRRCPPSSCASAGSMPGVATRRRPRATSTPRSWRSTRRGWRSTRTTPPWPMPSSSARWSPSGSGSSISRPGRPDGRS